MKKYAPVRLLQNPSRPVRLTTGTALETRFHADAAVSVAMESTPLTAHLMIVPLCNRSDPQVLFIGFYLRSHVLLLHMRLTPRLQDRRYLLCNNTAKEMNECVPATGLCKRAKAVSVAAAACGWQRRRLLFYLGPLIRDDSATCLYF